MRVWAGREDVRRVFHIAAFVASRCDPAPKAVRDLMKAAGKLTKVAILAIAGKHLANLNAVLRDQSDYA